MLAFYVGCFLYGFAAAVNTLDLVKNVISYRLTTLLFADIAVAAVNAMLLYFVMVVAHKSFLLILGLADSAHLPFLSYSLLQPSSAPQTIALACARGNSSCHKSTPSSCRNLSRSIFIFIVLVISLGIGRASSLPSVIQECHRSKNPQSCTLYRPHLQRLAVPTLTQDSYRSSRNKVQQFSSS